MVVTAILAIRSEEAYLANCLRHLMRNGIDFAIIDNESTDRSEQIYRRSEFAANLVHVERLPFRGSFSLGDQLRRKMAVIEALRTDWVIHLDADEIMHSYREGESLHGALSRLDAEGWNVVNFDEFVFLPIERDYLPEAPEDQPLSYYYFFEPSAPRLMRAWRKASGFSLVENGGHSLIGADLRLAPEHLALRHYIVRSQEHAFAKYANRRFATEDVALGWHSNRINQPMAGFKFPSPDLLKRLSAAEDRNLDRSVPWALHYWQRHCS